MFLFLSPLAFFCPPPFSVSLSLSLCCSFLFTFLLVFLFCFLFVSCFCLFLSLSFFIAFLFHEKKTSKYSIAILFPEIFSLSFGFMSCFSVSNPFLLSLLFPDFKLCFLFNINVFSFKKNKLKSTKKNQLQQNLFFYEPVFCKMWKVIVFFCPFFAKFWLMFKKHYKNRYFSKFLKAKKQKNAFWGVIIWAK